MQRINNNSAGVSSCLLDYNLDEITPIRDLPGHFGTCAQQCETSLLRSVSRNTQKRKTKISRSIEIFRASQTLACFG